MTQVVPVTVVLDQPSPPPVTQQLQPQGLRFDPALAWLDLLFFALTGAAHQLPDSLAIKTSALAAAPDPPHRRGDPVSIAWCWIKD